MSNRTLLLFAHRPAELATIGRALRDSGYVVFPSRYHETSADALVRVGPDLVLLDVGRHLELVTPAFQELVTRSGARVLLFAQADGRYDAAALQAVRDLPYPILEFTGDGRALAGLVAEVVEGRYAA